MMRAVMAALLVWSALNGSDCTALGAYGGRTVYKSADGLVSFVADIDVNTDGSAKSYHPQDPGSFANGRLNTQFALNTVCNGVTIRGQNDRTLYGPRQCAGLLKEFVRLRRLGWSEPNGNYVHWIGVAARTGGNRRQPCIARDGYFVSQTAKALDGGAEVCDPAHWPDALALSSIVLPFNAAMRAAGIRLGDVALVRLPSGATAGAVFLDTNNSQLGEGSVRLAMTLSGRPAPTSYRGVLALKLPLAEYFVFPGTAREVGRLRNTSEPDIQAAARKLAAAFAVDHRRACR